MSLSVGQRVSLGPHRGTIRYRGPVPPSTGEWLGIEWDDPTRGKHSGTSAGGTRYFDVRVPGSGSFVRATSSKLSSGCGFLSALRNKYLPAPATETEQRSGTEETQYSRKNIAEIEIETPNLERVVQKAARLDRLKEVGLGGWQQSVALEEGGEDARYDVARAYDEAERLGSGSIRETCPNIRWLDLSSSLLPNWEEVSLIAGELEQLKTLLLRFNRLQSPPVEVPASWRERLGRIEDLRLDGTLVQWKEVVRLSPALIGLKALHLGGNDIGTLTATSSDKADEKTFPSLTLLSLEDNAMASWPDLVAALSRLPSLETLILDRNRITATPSAPSSACKLPGLKELYLRGNQLDSWSSLENITTWLGSASGLKALHISALQDDQETANAAVPVTANGDLLSKYEYRDFRAIAIARLPTLKELDKTSITPKERRDAELFVYTRIRDGDAYILDGGLSRLGTREKLDLSPAEKAERFPRFLELAKAFDDEVPVATASQVGKGKSTLRSKMLSVTVVACETAPSVGRPHLAGVLVEKTVQVLASTPLRLCKIKLASAVGVKVGQVAGVWALMKQGDGGEEEERIVLEMDDLSRNLDWYEVASGDTVVLVVET
ncbi:Leucine rich repeat 4 [Kalmanozyma brasiliensis GHG001]|uniref:CAP-Gly domain-containing protein n=1 Tax=Kalmanozyma brasiliensis (strain GHG001) TaxID=1365824 RepID=V5GJD9_KALBG|nr:Leucine rich repeat 4 [Kalmanozyma brasiliensis GHG001]EST06052.1 Leucine rich repeat 4 [Kalmanozyma brasiliensis GHG001]